MLKSKERDKWLEAEKKEMEQMILNKTWTSITGRAPKKAITCRWVYKLKPPTSVQPEPIFKARLVAHGYKQKANFDYGETFAQVATLKAFRIFLWFSVVFGMKATQCDFTSAFLQGKIDKEIYMTGPPGHSLEGEIVKLNKSIYGIKQAPRIFYQTLVKFLHSLGFNELVTDSCVFKHHTQKFYILLWVDDMVLLGKDEKFRHHVHTQLKSKFNLKVLGDLKHFVGFQVDRDTDGSIHLHQTNYAQKILDTFAKFIPNNYKHSTPADHNIKLTKQQQPTKNTDQQNMKKYPYRQLIGSLLYLLGTRPELYFITISLSRFVCNPGWQHWLSAIYTLIYIKNTLNHGIHISIKQEMKISVYVDADWGSNIDDRKSISGYIIYLGSTPIIWRSKQQKGKPATSSCEAEYIAYSACINEVVWMVTFLTELGYSPILPLAVPIYTDSKSAKDLAHNPIHHDRTKHIDISYHRIREFILDGTISLHYIHTSQNPADIFTKNVDPSTFKYLINFIYNCHFNPHQD